MKVAITGGTGFVGRGITQRLIDEGHHVYILTRFPEKHKDSPHITHVGWMKTDTFPEKKLPALDAIVNLAGESLFGHWTAKKKQRILTSRLQATEAVLQLIKQMESKPNVLVNASAIGFYGTSKSNAFTENTITPGNDFLAKVTREWERKAEEARAEGVRTVFTRFGMVLGSEGSLPLMALPFKYGIGGKIGSGEQWISWVHIRDAADIVVYSIKNNQVSGPVNVTAPAPKRNKEFSSTLAEVLRRPNWLPVPGIAVKTALGEMSLLVTEGQCVYPQTLQTHGYTFHFPELSTALRDIFITD